jgi:hypothetical protein
MIRLHGALRNDDIRILFDGIGHQEFELAGFVAAGTESGAVITLHVDIRAAKVRAQARQQL